MKKYNIWFMLCISMFFHVTGCGNDKVNKSEGKRSLNIYYVSVLETGEISVEAHEREIDSGKYIRSCFLKIQKNGDIKKKVELDCNGNSPYLMIGFDSEDNLWLCKDDGKTYYSKNLLYKISSENIRKQKKELELISGDFHGGGSWWETTPGIFKKDLIYIFPNVLSKDMGKTWEDLGVDNSVTDANENIRYAFQPSTFTIYKSIFKRSGSKTIIVKIERFNWETRRWASEEEFILDDNKTPIWNNVFLVSRDYYVFSCEDAHGKEILSYNRKNRKTKHYKNVFPECSDYEIVGPEPHVIYDEKLFCQCLRGGYVVLDLKSGDIKREEFNGKYCKFYKSPSSDYLLLVSVSKLFISFDKGMNWKEILDVEKVKY